MEAVHSHKQLLVKNLYWSIQHYYLQHMCVCVVYQVVRYRVQVQFNHLGR